MYSALVTTLGDLVKARRENLHLTQRALAERVGVSQTYIYNIEKGKNDIPSPDVMGRLARALEIAEEVLLQSVGYLKDQASRVRRHMFAQPLGPDDFWRQLVEIFDGDEDAARRFLYDALGAAIEDHERTTRAR